MHHDKSLLHNRYHVKGVYKRPFWRTRQNWSQCSWLVPRPDNQWWRVQSPSKEHWTPPGTVLVSWVWSPAIGGAVAVATLPFCLHIRPMCTATNTPALMIAVKLRLKCCCLSTKKQGSFCSNHGFELSALLSPLAGEASLDRNNYVVKLTVVTVILIVITYLSIVWLSSIACYPRHQNNGHNNPSRPKRWSPPRMITMFCMACNSYLGQVLLLFKSIPRIKLVLDLI